MRSRIRGSLLLSPLRPREVAKPGITRGHGRALGAAPTSAVHCSSALAAADVWAEFDGGLG